MAGQNGLLPVPDVGHYDLCQACAYHDLVERVRADHGTAAS
jgi:hypothetical protein